MLALPVLTLLACARPPGGPEPKLSPPGAKLADLGVEANEIAAITSLVSEQAIRRPATSAMVDAQIEAMLEYTKQRFRHPIDEDLSTVPSPHLEESEELHGDAVLLSLAARKLASYLPLQTGPAELENVALQKLVRLLGDDAALRPGRDEPRVSLLTPVVDADLGMVSVPDLSEGMAERLLRVIEEWRARERPLRALVLDLSDCTRGDVPGLAAVSAAFGVNQFIGVSHRDSDSQSVKSGMLAGELQGTPVSKSLRVFVVTSTRTDGPAEALAFALQRGGAAVLGAATRGSGRLFAWIPVRESDSFGFAIGDFLGPDGLSLKGRPVVPDACVSTGGALVTLSDATLSGFRAACQEEPVLSPPTIFDHVRQTMDRLASEAGTTPG